MGRRELGPLARAEAILGDDVHGPLVVGLITSLFQSVTSIQEPTLTFAPKLLTFAGLSLLLAPWLLRSMGEFTISMFARMVALAH